MSSDSNDYLAMKAALGKAKRNGLSGALFRCLAESGNLLLAQQFAQLSRSHIQQYEGLFGARGAHVATARQQRARAR